MTVGDRFRTLLGLVDRDVAANTRTPIYILYVRSRSGRGAASREVFVRVHKSCRQLVVIIKSAFTAYSASGDI